MRNVLTFLLVGLIVACGSGTGRAQEPDAKGVVLQAIKASGGEEALTKHRTMTWTETGTYHGMGTPLPYTGKYAAQFPHFFRMEIEGVFTLVYAGDKGWTKMGGEVKEMGKDELAAQKIDQQAGWAASLLPLTGKEYTLTSLGESKDGDRVLLGVKVTRAEHPEVKLYFDKKTNLLARSVFTGKSSEMMFKDVTTELTFVEYTTVEGAKTPSKIRINRDGKVFVEAELKEHKTVAKLDAALFGKP